MADFTLFPTTTMGAAGQKPQRLTIQGFKDDKLYIVKLDGGVRPNFQLMYAIGPGIYLNAFQQRMSLFNLEGLHILADCKNNVDTEEPAFFQFYKANNIVASVKMLTMAFNKITMTGYLVDLRIQNYNQDNVEGYIWTLQFLGWINNLTVAKAMAAAAGAAAGNTVAQNINAEAPIFSVGGTRYQAVTYAGAVRNPNVDTSFSVSSANLSPAFDASRLAF